MASPFRAVSGVPRRQYHRAAAFPDPPASAPGAFPTAAASEQGHRFARGDGEMDRMQDPAVVRIIVTHPGSAE
ncbi:hypothetical protein KPZU09_56750 [Klebsiella pneumoniae]|uniref:Uncharacterized protein n=1 Tax=Klebsiella pneumoniae TaxID=573 RepID=A0A919I158_KLEPN|nr:hypothetical protein KPZU09_56750 [Klebsiella pneumoniae]